MRSWGLVRSPLYFFLISLRRIQFQLAEINPAMAIFLGKNYLGQKDRREIDENKQTQIVFVDDVRE